MLRICLISSPSSCLLLVFCTEVTESNSKPASEKYDWLRVKSNSETTCLHPYWKDYQERHYLIQFQFLLSYLIQLYQICSHTFCIIKLETCDHVQEYHYNNICSFRLLVFSHLLKVKQVDLKLKIKCHLILCTFDSIHFQEEKQLQTLLDNHNIKVPNDN